MGTRAVIARPTGAGGDADTFAGVYVHADGAPTATGRNLWKQTVTRFGGDVDAAARYFIDQHPTGWATLGEAIGTNECYCHDESQGTAGAVPITQGHASEYPFIYVLTESALFIRRADRPGAVRVPWAAERVDWELLERRALAL